MKSFVEFIKKNSNVANMLASIALVFTVIAANSPCCCIYHQPEKPEMKKMRKF